MSEHATVVTSENRAEFMAQKLDLAAPEVVEAAPEVKSEPAIETKQEEAKEPAAEPAAEEDKHKEPEKKSNPKLEKRFSELTAKRDAALAEAQREREAREALEAKLAQLEGKEPTKSEAPKKPNPADYTDAFQYAEDLAAYTANQAFEERESKSRELEQQNALQKAWSERMALAAEEIPDLQETIATSDVQVTAAVRDAILTSEVGPKLLYHLAENPDVAAKLNGLSPIEAVRMIGKLETQLEKKPEPVKEAPKVEVSKAPAPIAPLKAATATPDNLINEKGEFTGTPAQYRELRMAGKIK